MKAVLDVETTTYNTGNPFDKRNCLVVVGLMFCDNDWNQVSYKHYYDVEELANDLKRATILLGFNFKFDLHWLRNVGITTNAILRDAQLAEFIISNQQSVLPSLEGCASQYLNEHKLDIIKKEYWGKGIETWDIPPELLEEYLYMDVELTRKVYKLQESILKESGKWNLYKLQCADLKVLQEIEYNGILYNAKKSKELAGTYTGEIISHRNTICAHSDCPSINPASGDHISAILYGGTITADVRYPVGEFKSGKKVGQTRYKILQTEYTHPRLVEPIKGSELKKEGYYSTDEQTLKSLKPRNKELKRLVSAILELSKTEKLVNTYFLGIPALMQEMRWKESYIHGQFNQCITRTGRLSSSKPNLQNFDPYAKQLCVSRYDS